MRDKHPEYPFLLHCARLCRLLHLNPSSARSPQWNKRVRFAVKTAGQADWEAQTRTSASLRLYRHFNNSLFTVHSITSIPNFTGRNILIRARVGNLVLKRFFTGLVCELCSTELTLIPVPNTFPRNQPELSSVDPAFLYHIIYDCTSLSLRSVWADFLRRYPGILPSRFSTLSPLDRLGVLTLLSTPKAPIQTVKALGWLWSRTFEAVKRKKHSITNTESARRRRSANQSS
jgi:hypothetical protein